MTEMPHNEGATAHASERETLFLCLACTRYLLPSLFCVLTFEAPAHRGAVVVLSILEDLVELGGESLGRASSSLALHWRLGIGGFSSWALAGRSRLSPVLHHDPRELANYARPSASLF